MAKSKERRESLVYHAKPRPGKIEVVPTKKYNSQRDLALHIPQVLLYPVKRLIKTPQMYTSTPINLIWLL